MTNVAARTLAITVASTLFDHGCAADTGTPTMIPTAGVSKSDTNQRRPSK
jgi:hypothetical protein